jgi:glycerol kinase
MNRFYLSIDQGTTSSRAIVFDLKDGYAAVKIALAAQKSAATGETVDMQHFF